MGLVAVYDLAVSPPTYDFVAFLLAAETYRQETRQDFMKVLVVRGHNGGFRQDELPPRDPKDRERMLQNIVLPMAKLLPSCHGIEVIERGEVLLKVGEDDVFPPDYQTYAPKFAYGLRFMVQAAKQKIFPLAPIPLQGYGEKCVTITLRKAGYWATRDSNVEEWLKVADALTKQGRRVIFVPDTSGHDIDGYEVDELASTDLMRRFSLYAACGLNLFVNNGPGWVASFCPNIAMMMFKLCAPGAPAVSPKFFELHGFPVGSQFSRPGHRMVWADDDAETILAEIERPSEAQPYVYPNTGNTTVRFFLDNMRENCARDLPWFTPQPIHNGSLVICGGGPSIKKNLSAIRDRQKRGQTILALNNAWRILVSHGIMPDIVAAMDAREENKTFFEDAPKEPTYFIASTSHPAVFEALKDNKVSVWHPDQCQPEQHEILKAYQDKPAALIGGGNTIGLRSLILGFWKGYRRFHLYGMDSSLTGEEHHAYPQPLNDNDKIIEIKALDKTYQCARWMARQADEFQKFYRTLSERGCVIQAHGDGLLPDLCRHHNRQRMENLKEIA